MNGLPLAGFRARQVFAKPSYCWRGRRSGLSAFAGNVGAVVEGAISPAASVFTERRSDIDAVFAQGHRRTPRDKNGVPVWRSLRVRDAKLRHSRTATDGGSRA
jgi:hypothetical protein